MNSQVASPIAQPMDGVRVSTAAAPGQLVLERVGADFAPTRILRLDLGAFTTPKEFTPSGKHLNSSIHSVPHPSGAPRTRPRAGLQAHCLMSCTPR